jgi:hypothetical protein
LWTGPARNPGQTVQTTGRQPGLARLVAILGACLKAIGKPSDHRGNVNTEGGPHFPRRSALCIEARKSVQ